MVWVESLRPQGVLGAGEGQESGHMALGWPGFSPFSVHLSV